jgi:hypothetical protein
MKTPAFPHARHVALAVSIAITLHLASLNAALAHTGHAHEQDGMNLDGVLEVAGTAAAIVIVYVLATWFFRYRDRGRQPDT